jgi:cell division protein FtsW
MASAAAATLDVHATVRASHIRTGWEAPALMLITLALLSFGLVSVYSASAVMAQSSGQADYFYVVRQLVGGALGLIALVVMAQLDYRHLRLFAWPVLLVVIAMLVIIILPGTEAIAPPSNHARRWLNLGPVQVQPSEFAKLALIIWTAALTVKKQDKLSSLTRGLVPFLVVWGLVEILIFLEPSFSAAAITLLLAMLVVYAGGARIGHFILLGFVALPLLLNQIGDGYRFERVLTWLHRTLDPAGAGYQIKQALIAIGSGGLFGRGLGHGLQKFHFLPEPHNDFLLAMIGEEWGFLGVLVVIALFAALGLIGYRIAREAPDFFGFLLAIGLTNLIVVQALLHIAVNLALIPTTGVTLPFMSYGRSSLLVCLASVGILLNIARRAEASTE